MFTQGVVVQFRSDKLGNVVNAISEEDDIYLGLNKLDSLTQTRRDLVIEKYDNGFNLIFQWKFNLSDVITDYWLIDFTKDALGYFYLLVSNRLWPSPNYFYNSIIKISPFGIKMWEKAISAQEQWAAANITKIKFSKLDNTIVVSGSSPWGGDPVVKKYDLDGNLIFETSIDLPLYSKFHNFQVLNDTSIVAVGTYDSYLGTYDNILIVTKFRPNGSVIWNKTFYSGVTHGPDSSDAEAYDVCETDDGNLFIVGYVTQQAWVQASYVLLMKLNQSGDSLFTRKFIQPSWTHEKNIGYNIINFTGNYYLIYGVQNDGYTSRIPTLLKIDNEGNLIYKQVGFYHPDDVYLRTVTSQGNLILTGDTRSDEITWAGRAPLVYKTTIAGLYMIPNFHIPWTDYTVISQPSEFVLYAFKQNYQTLEVQISMDSSFNSIDIQYSDPSHFNVDSYGYIRFMVSGLVSNSTYYIRCRAIDYEVQYANWSNAVRFTTGNLTDVSNSMETFSFDLRQNYPNPFNSKTLISFSIPERSIVQLNLYDVLGNEIATLVNEILNKGSYSYRFDASKFSSGIYFYELKSGKFIKTKKMIYIK